MVIGFDSFTKPTAGPQSEDAVAVGNSAFQLYSLAPPNGQKTGIFFEKIDIDYGTWVQMSGGPCASIRVS